jgi:ABC-type glycerol-3-phosphate transport system permease component
MCKYYVLPMDVLKKSAIDLFLSLSALFHTVLAIPIIVYICIIMFIVVWNSYCLAISSHLQF